MIRPHSKWKLALKTLPFVVAVLVLKWLAHQYNYEVLSLSSLFTAIVSANIFLIGFLISGTLVDYKESEKIPSDLASSLQTLADEGFILNKAGKKKVAQPFLEKVLTLNQAIIEWFTQKEPYEALQDQLRSLNDDFLAFEKETQPNFIVRLKQEQNHLRKTLNRAKVIRETSFLSTGYAVAEIITFVLILALIFIQMEYFYESLFFAGFISFMLIYMIFFIKDLDNPFGYGKNGVAEEVSLKPLLEGYKRLKLHMKNV